MMHWQHGHEGMYYVDVPAIRLEVYPPQEADDDQWTWWAVEYRSGNTLARGLASSEQEARAAAEAHA